MRRLQEPPPNGAPEVWISIDVETSGPTPSVGCLLSVGACLVDDPSVGIEVWLRPDPRLPWSDEAEAIHGLSREQLEREGLEPSEALELLEQWLAETVPPGARPIMTALNAPFDWMFLADAFWHHRGHNPFGHSAIDVKALYLGRYRAEGLRWRDTRRTAMLGRHPVALPHTHRALDDAREQALLLRAILGLDDSR